MNKLMGFTLCFVGAFASLSTLGLEPLPESPLIPKDNPMNKDKIELGRMLYFDTRLSGDRTVSCNTCHDVMGAGIDGLPKSKGIKGQIGGRNAPTVFNSAYLSVQFWDGRAATLEEQAKGPITNPIEMGLESHEVAVEVISSVPEYRKKFKKAFGSKSEVSIDTIAKAIAAFERTLVTPDAPLDRYLKGDKKALSERQIAGMETFKSVGCVSCHSGPMLAGPNLPMGTGFYQKFPLIPGSEYDQKYKFTDDLGRYEVTQNESDKHSFRVPSLRNVAKTAPYFHNGSVDSLDEAVRVMAKTQLNKDLTNEEVENLVAFLESLTGVFPKEKVPRLPKDVNKSNKQAQMN